MNCDLGILGIQNLIPRAAFHGIFEYSSNNIPIFEPKIFEYSYSVHLMITNIFVFVFGPECDPEYIRIRVKKNILNVFVFGPKKNTLWQNLSISLIHVFSTFCNKFLVPLVILYDLFRNQIMD